MKNIKYLLILIDYYITTLTNETNEFLGNDRYELPSIINGISTMEEEKIYDLKELINIKEYLNILLKFQQILETKLSHCNFDNFYQRLKTLIINEIYTDDIGSSGDYRALINKLNVYKSKEIDNIAFEHIIFHELLHLASTYQYKKIVLIGFCQVCNFEKYFEGINEGYTEVLNLRYFSSKPQNKGAYPISRFLSLGIEAIVGKEKMERLYFQGDLDGLIDELCIFASFDEIYIVLKNMDIIRRLETDEFEDEDRMIKATRLSLETSNIIANIKRRSLINEENEFKILQNAFYSSGTILEKTETGYTLSLLATNKILVSQDAYRIIKEHFFKSEQSKHEYTSTGYDISSIETTNKFHKHIVLDFNIDTIVGYAMTLLEIANDENLDLANIETIELTKEEKKVKRKIITRTK